MSDWKTLVREDREAVLARDPAAKSMAEVRLCYPGLVALKSHRRAHALYEKGHVLLAGGSASVPGTARALRFIPARPSAAGCSSTMATGW